MTAGIATYFDGVTAVAHPVRATLSPPFLLLHSVAGEAVATWPLATLRVRDRAGGGLRLGPAGADARLAIADAGFADLVAAALPPPRRRLGVALLAGLAVAAALPALWFAGPLLADTAARAVPHRWEAALGELAVRQLAGQATFCTDPAGQAALDALAGRLADAAGMAPPPVRVLDRPEVNAFTAPGGAVVLLRGALRVAGSADEIAAVLAHEFGHVRLRHPLRGLVRATGLSMLAAAVTGGSEIAALAAGLVSLSYSRAFEREADAAALATLRAAGLRTGGLAAFLTRAEPRSRGALPGYLATHPPPEERRAAEAVGGDAGADAMPPERWAELRAICSGAP